MWVSVAVSVSPSASGAALTVTVCGVFQLIVVNVSVSCTPGSAFVSNVTSVLPPDARATLTVTSPVGCLTSRTV